ncbi:MAG: hypothetical protein ACYTET_02280 [Planctomycetota bacterium]|jgi:hypothetical protein
MQERKKRTINIVAYSILLLCTFAMGLGLVRFLVGYYAVNILLGAIYGIGFEILVCLLWVFLLILLIADGVSQFEFGRRKVNIKSLIPRATVLMSVFLILYLCSLLYPPSSANYSPFMKGFQRRIENRLNVESLREWIDSLDEGIFKEWNQYNVLYQNEIEYTINNENSETVLKDDNKKLGPMMLLDPMFHSEIKHPENNETVSIPIPWEISCLADDVHYLSFDNENGMRSVNIQWGGPFHDWGVVVGPKEMPIPETVDVSYDEGGFPTYGEYRFKVEDGVYVWEIIK